MADFELLVPMFAGSANSLRTLEIWSMSHNSVSVSIGVDSRQHVKLVGTDRQHPP